MSNTPRSDSEQRGDFVHIRFARELERENAALRKDKERLEVERCECLRTMDLALNNSAVLRELVNEPYQFFRFGHKALMPWGKSLDKWCKRAEKLGFKKA